MQKEFIIFKMAINTLGKWKMVQGIEKEFIIIRIITTLNTMGNRKMINIMERGFFIIYMVTNMMRNGKMDKKWSRYIILEIWRGMEEWKNGQRNGKGIMYFSDGEEKKQYWKDGKRDFIR